MNETFSTTEQGLVKLYLQGGGDLFVSGAEIGWDLDHLGTVSDKDFYNNYLMATYLYDAPNAGTAGSCYLAMAHTGFYTNDSVEYDDGTHGTYNVNYPDVFAANGTAVADMSYCSGTENGMLHYDGMFPSATAAGKLVYWAFPFETVYDGVQRNSLMGNIIDYFFGTAITTGIAEENGDAFKVYPNPSDGIFTLETTGAFPNSEYIVTDLTGRIIVKKQLIQSPGIIDLSEFPAGIYILNYNGHATKIIKN